MGYHSLGPFVAKRLSILLTGVAVDRANSHLAQQGSGKREVGDGVTIGAIGADT